MGTPRTAEGRACAHDDISAMTVEGDAQPSVWACRECRRRFYPACPVCVDVGHRNIEHPAAEPGRGALRHWTPELLRAAREIIDTSTSVNREFARHLLNQLEAALAAIRAARQGQEARDGDA